MLMCQSDVNSGPQTSNTGPAAHPQQHATMDSAVNRLNRLAGQLDPVGQGERMPLRELAGPRHEAQAPLVH